MSDLQQRLRDAIAASVDGAEPSFDLMSAVRRRHRQRLRRLAAAGAAAVMVVAVRARSLLHATPTPGIRRREPPRPNPVSSISPLRSSRAAGGCSLPMREL